MSSYYIKVLSTAFMGGLGASILVNASKSYYPESLDFYGSAEPIMGGLLLINALLLGYAYHEIEEAEQWYGKRELGHVQRQLNAQRARCVVGILFILMAVSAVLMAIKEDETSPLGWISYVMMLAGGAYLSGSSGSYLLAYDEQFMVLRATAARVYLNAKQPTHRTQDPEAKPKYQSKLVNHLYGQHREKTDEKLRLQRERGALGQPEPSSPSWLDRWF